MRRLTNLEHLLLGLLHQKPASGYALRKSFATTPLGHYSDSPASIYPALNRPRRNLVRPMKDQPATGRGTLVFLLTPGASTNSGPGFSAQSRWRKRARTPMASCSASSLSRRSSGETPPGASSVNSKHAQTKLFAISKTIWQARASRTRLQRGLLSSRDWKAIVLKLVGPLERAGNSEGASHAPITLVSQELLAESGCRRVSLLGGSRAVRFACFSDSFPYSRSESARTNLNMALIFALGLAYWYLVGLFGLIQVTWMPLVLRIGHSFEIGADSFVYAAVLVLLFVPRHRESTVSTPAHAAPLFPS